MRFRVLIVLSLAVVGCLPGSASTLFIPPDGTIFQYVFETDGTYVATSGSISTYNTDVTSDANNTLGSLVSSLGLNWTCLCSTAGTNVLSNIATQTGAEIIDVLGDSIATGTSGLYGGVSVTLGNPLDYTDLGTKLTGTPVWTGTGDSGLTDHQLGVVGIAETGESDATDLNWTMAHHTVSTSTLGTLYAISPLLEVTAQGTIEVVTPEPGTLGLTLLGFASCYLAMRRRRAVVSVR